MFGNILPTSDCARPLAVGPRGASGEAERRRARAACGAGAAGSPAVSAESHCEGSGKFDRARSRLYRSQILQENMRLKALAEIYTMHFFAQL